jgi:hypothetical protein
MFLEFNVRDDCSRASEGGEGPKEGREDGKKAHSSINRKKKQEMHS